MKTLLLGLMFISTSLFASVKMYTQNGCGACEAAKQYLQRKHITYSECNISRPDCLYEFDKIGGVATPTFVVNGRVIVGLDPKQLEQALRNK